MISVPVITTGVNNMKTCFAFLGVVLTLGLVSATSLQRFIIKEVTVEVKPNPYVKAVDVTINGEYNDTVTIKMPIYEKVPEDLVLNNYIIYNGEQIPPLRGDLCGLFDDKTFAPDVLAAGIPEDVFPKQCPILPNDQYTILNYQFSAEKLPPGLPDGTVLSTIYVSQDGNDDNSVLIIRAESLLRTDTPQMSSLTG